MAQAPPAVDPQGVISLEFCRECYIFNIMRLLTTTTLYIVIYASRWDLSLFLCTYFVEENFSLNYLTKTFSENISSS